MIIGLTGLAGSGKDTVAALLAMRGFTRYAFADELRKEAAAVVRRAQNGGIDPSSPVSASDVCAAFEAYGHEVKMAIITDELTPEMVWEKPTAPLMRVLLQKHGTEFRRQQDTNYWVSKLMGQIANDRDANWRNTSPEEGEPRVVITDVRFLNEAKAIRERGGHIWRVVRPTNTVALAHVSESEQKDIIADVELINDGTVYDLAVKVRGIL